MLISRVWVKHNSPDTTKYDQHNSQAEKRTGPKVRASLADGPEARLAAFEGRRSSS